MNSTASSLPQRGFSRWLHSTMAAFDGLSLTEQAAMLTLPLLLLYTQDEWYVRVPVICLSVGGLVFSQLRHNAYFWFALVCFMGTGIAFTWEASDNHKYAITYWCLALFFVQWFAADLSNLRTSARLLLGLIFGFAVLWKAISPDFSSGDFFQHAFLFDERFSGKLALLGIVDAEAMELNGLARQTLTSFDGSFNTVSISIPPSLPLMAKGLAWWTLALEGLIALCFLLPATNRLAKWGDPLLVLFILSTYVIAPVIGFGWLLIIMGVIQCAPTRKGMRFAYLASLLLLQLFRLPWATVADSFFQ